MSPVFEDNRPKRPRSRDQPDADGNDAQLQSSELGLWQGSAHGALPQLGKDQQHTTELVDMPLLC